MNTTSLDTLLSVTLSKPVAVPVTRPVGNDAPSFDRYLREASQPALAPPQSATESPSVSAQNEVRPPEESYPPAEEPTATAGQEQQAADSSQEQATDAPSSEVQGTSEAKEEGATDEQPSDETLVSAVAAAVLAKATPETDANGESSADKQAAEAGQVTQSQESGQKPAKQNPIPGAKVLQEAEAPAAEVPAVEKASAQPLATAEKAAVREGVTNQTQKAASASQLNAESSEKAGSKQDPSASSDKQSAQSTSKQQTSDDKKAESTGKAATPEEVGQQETIPSNAQTGLVATETEAQSESPTTGEIKDFASPDDEPAEVAVGSKQESTVEPAPLENVSSSTHSTSDGKGQLSAPVTANANVSAAVGAITSVSVSHAEATSGQSQLDANTEVSTVDRTRFVQRVANAFRSAQSNEGHIQLRLSPPELGSLRIEIAVRNGVLSANLETETAEARRVVLDNLPALRQRLAEQDIRIDKFEVDVRRDGGQSGSQTGAENWQSRQSEGRAAANRLRTAPVSTPAANVTRSQVSPTAGSLDVLI
jgi:flagellar hook-length control protein FliK